MIKLDNQCFPSGDAVECIGPLDRYDDIDELLIDICECLEEQKVFQFVIEGFGLDWNLDVGTDFSTIVIDLPKNIGRLGRNSDFRIELFEQGVERTLLFEPSNEKVKVSCLDMKTSKLLSEHIVIDKANLSRQLHVLLDDFLEKVQQLFEEVSRAKIFVEWALSREN
ncbi:MAG: hypothetical protein AAF730_12200 [Bacteroidota bacterium]